MQIRLLFALALSFLLYPALMPILPHQPEEVSELVRLIAGEALIGIFFGSMMQLLMITVETAGSVISAQMGLSNAMILNPMLATQSTLPSAFMGSAALALLFLTGLDHLLLRGLMDTYEVFPSGAEVEVSDMLQSYMRLVGRSFQVGVELAGPFLIIGLLLNVALGIMQRMIPQVQLFLVIVPVQIWGGMALFAATMGVMMTAWLRFSDSAIGDLLAR